MAAPELLVAFIASLDGNAAAEGRLGSDALGGATTIVFSTTVSERAARPDAAS